VEFIDRSSAEMHTLLADAGLATRHDYVESSDYAGSLRMVVMEHIGAVDVTDRIYGPGQRVCEGCGGSCAWEWVRLWRSTHVQPNGLETRRFWLI
jgi:hypothetical protein